MRGARAFRARGRGDGGKHRLAGERHLVSALDVMARRANALVREQAGNKIVHQLDSQCSHKPPAARRKRACGLRHEAYGLRLMAVWATLAHGRARADLRLEPRGRGGSLRLVPRPRGPERRDAARRPAVPLRARPRARGQEAAAPPDGGPGHRGGRHRPAGGGSAGGGAGAGARHGDPERQAAHRPELRRAHRDRGRRADRARGPGGGHHDRGRDVHRLVADPAVRRGLDPRSHRPIHGGGGDLRREARPPGHVRHRGHDPREARGAQSTLRGRDRLRGDTHLPRGYRRACHAGWRAGLSAIREERDRQEEPREDRLARAPRPRPRADQLSRGDRGRRGPGARYRARGGGAGGERGDGPPDRELEAPGRASPRHLEAAGILPAGGERSGCADRRELPGDGGGRVPHRHGRARGGHHQGQEEGARVARRPRLQLRAGAGVRARAEDRDLAGIGALQREVLARDPRLRPGGRGGVPRAVRGGEAHRPRAVGRGVPPAAQAGGMAVAPFREIERSYFDLRWHLDPVGATQAGVKTYDDRYGRFSPQALAPHLAALKSIASALEETTADEREDEIDRTALLNEIRVTLRRFERERPQAKNPGFWLSHLLGGLHFLLGRRDRTPEERAVSLAGRLEDVPGLLDDARAALVEPVRVFVETALRINEGGLSLVREVASGLGERVAAAADAAAAAMAAFAHDLERWLESASDQFALGEEDFNFHLHYEHALRDTAPELWRYGLHLKEELELDLAARAKRLDKSKSWQDVADRLRADHPPASALVDAYAGEMARARDFVATHGLVPIPDAPLDVVPTPAFMRPIIPFAAYDPPGSYSPDRTGWFYVTLPDPALPPSAQDALLRDHCRYELGVTALHEGYPGHHLHLVHAQQQPSDTRKVVWTPLTVEGWALYCEDMMGEEGFYQSEEEQFFQRVHLLWRATRVLLDVGLHTRGMTFEQAVEHMTTHLRVDRANAEAEVRRYCAEAAQPLCYAVGRREILELRKDFRAARGKAFTLRRFHDALLRYGGLPVTLIRWGLGLNEQ